MHSSDLEKTPIEVLREMVRIAENRRAEELKMVDRMNRYNLALIAFSGSFLSLIVTVNLASPILISSGLFLSLSIIFSLIAIYPRKLVGGVLAIDQDIIVLKEGHILHLHTYLLEVASLTDSAAQKAGNLVTIKKKWTIFSAAFLAFSIIVAYILSVCHVLKIF